MKKSKRDHILETAQKLFANQGYQRTSVDQIIAAAEVAKMTVYNHFPTKADLVTAVVRRRDQALIEYLTTKAAAADTPREKLLALFDALEAFVKTNPSEGCTFLNVIAEYASADEEPRQAAANHKASCHKYIQHLATQARAADPQALADQLMLLIDGALSNARRLNNHKPSATAKQAAAILINQQFDQ
ncbi:TetR/AcrR family transcriptional regulator [Mucisphaera sp.]|uniref:TetR/AcrR family transcriptional regulator n=1 Tax=Mucisphaera sp. TaxID=2913024 RepID=UPI003D124C8C